MSPINTAFWKEELGNLRNHMIPPKLLLKQSTWQSGGRELLGGTNQIGLAMGREKHEYYVVEGAAAPMV